ncbi:MAG: undecaprenyl-phosphate glucose phosphotransferase [Pseudomonadota bacterium]
MTIQQDISLAEPRQISPRSNAGVLPELLPGIVLGLDLLMFIGVGFASFLALVETSGYVIDYYMFAVVLVTLVSVLSMQQGGLYKIASIITPMRLIDVLIAAILTAFLFLLAVIYALKLSGLYQVNWHVAFGAASVFGLVASRMAIGMTLRALLRKRLIGRRMAVLGAGVQGRRFLQRLTVHPSHLSTVSGVYDPDPPLIGASVSGHTVNGTIDDLIRAARDDAFDEIVLALPADGSVRPAEIVQRLRELPVNVYLAPDVTAFGVPLKPLNRSEAGAPLFEVWQRPISGWNLFLKFAEDYLLAVLALMLLAPALLLIALAIRLDSPGPVLFRQKRLGFNNQVFEIFKFRTMYHRDVPEKCVVQASQGDSRVTRVGRILRKTSLDELPQLLNVLNGTMSLVGPRPHALSHNEDFSRSVRGYFGRHKVKPGITGWAQVNGLRGEIDSHSKLEARISHDVHYAENWSLFFDIRILFVTVIVVLFQKAAY